ncbi:MAG: DNA polymerase III subunit alpha [Patescibacteria group bacterium]|jgi:DNA polymerase-3 subunit alpha|nr:DNA polymerase III subunit alpha [bacterium]
MSFVHLHNHTHYSLLDGLTKIDEMVNYAKEQGSPAVAITDHGSMYGVIEFYQKAKKAGIKPIIGVETYLAPGSRFDKNTKEDSRSYHLVLLAKNQTGYKNLIKLVSAAHLEGFYYKPRVDWELLTKHHDGLIASSACLAGEIPRLIVTDKLQEAEKRIKEYQALFGADNYYLELMHHPELPELEKVNAELIKFSKKLNVPLIATNDVHYFKKEDAEAQDILLCLQNKKKITDTDRLKMLGYGDYSMRSNAEMIAAFKHVPEAISNTLKIAEMCNLEIELGKIQLPYFEVPAGHDGNSLLRKWCEEGIAKRYPNYSAEDLLVVKERLDYELSVIAKMGWPSYFLIVADFINWAKDNKIVVGPGRGSAAGSLVCYLTEITNLDPLKYDLLFERFLNPDRISMPDIDMDFADTRRGEVLNYVGEKYGYDHVAQIITFGTMAARAAVRDVGRVLDAPYDYCDKISKSIPMFMKLEEAIKTVPEVREMYQTEPMAKRILDYAKRLEGVARHTSTHACGVLITDKPLTEYVPIQYASSSDQTIISQYSLHPIEDLGLLKMDFLGLKNLTIIESALKIIKNTRGLEIDIDEIPLDDELTYKLFQAGETTGVFQFESAGMKRYLRELKPTVFEDIIAMVALYRPGPMEWIPDYIAGKHQRKKVSYLHPKLEGILNKTYGVAIYQEQVMQIARDLAGFTMGQADVLRKAVGKKIASLLAEQKEKFIEGCVKNGVYKELAEKVFSFIEPFAGYGFNRSHAACYALIGYQTAYLKAHWPVEFMAALLTADYGDSDRIAIEIEECRNMGIKIMPPDINESFGTFTVVTPGTKDNKAADPNIKLDTIRFGLKAIKNVGEHIVDELIKIRKQDGPYQDIFDLLKRVTDKDLNKKSLESLIKGGALESFGERGLLLANLEKFLSFNKEEAKQKDSRQDSLFAELGSEAISLPTLNPAPPAEKNEMLAWEKELLGLYVSEHPFNLFKRYLTNYALPLAHLGAHKNDDSIITAGVITNIKKIITRKGDSMIFVKIEDAISSVELLIFPRLYKETNDFWLEGRAVIVTGKISEKDQDLKILVDQVALLDLASPEKSIDDFKKKITANASNLRQKFVNGFKRNLGFKKTPAQSAPTSSVPTSPVSTSSVPTSSASALPESPQIPTEPEINNQGSKPLLLSFIKDLSANELTELRSLFAQNSGRDNVYFKIIEGGKYKVIKTAFLVENNQQLQQDLQKKFAKSIKITS